MKITLNELRNLVRNILKENIEFPVIDKDDENGLVKAFRELKPQAESYLSNNLKILNADGQYSLPSNVNLNPSSVSEGWDGKYFGLSTLYIYEKNQNFIVIDLKVENHYTKEGKIEVRSTLKRQNNPTFESENDLLMLAEFLNGYSKTFMREIPKNVIFYTLKQQLGVGGGNNSSNVEGTTSQKTYDNFDKWINTIQDTNIKGKIEAYHELLSPEEFNIKIKSMF